MGRYQSHLSYSLVLNHKLNEYDYFLDIEYIYRRYGQGASPMGKYPRHLSYSLLVWNH